VGLDAAPHGHLAEHWAEPAVAGPQPGLEGTHRAGGGAVATRDADLAPLPFLVGLTARQLQAEAVAGLTALGSPAAAASEGFTETWHDAARDRSLPVRLRLPAGDGPAPTILLSHGLGGSRDGLGCLGRALAEAGFIVAHLQHPGTDSALWQCRAYAFGAMAAAIVDPRRKRPVTVRPAVRLRRKQSPS
jgi:hypothetical protein